jgi:predicted nucleic acid-binding protein
LRYLLDTTTLINILGADERTSEYAHSQIGDPDSETYASVISRGELLWGAYASDKARREKELGAVETLLGRLDEVLPVTAEVADAFGEIAAYLDARGQRIPNNDAWIAATAWVRGLILVSTDEHFTRLPWLVVENWAADPQI